MPVARAPLGASWRLLGSSYLAPSRGGSYKSEKRRFSLGTSHCVLGCGQSVCQTRSIPTSPQRVKPPPAAAGWGPGREGAEERGWHGQQGGLCHGAGIRPSKGVSALDPSPWSIVPRGWSSAAAQRYVGGLRGTRAACECRNPQSLSKPMGWILGSPRWKGEGRGVVVKCRFTKIAQTSAAEGWRSAGEQPPGAGGAMPWVCVIPRASRPPPIT